MSSAKQRRDLSNPTAPPRARRLSEDLKRAKELIKQAAVRDPAGAYRAAGYASELRREGNDLAGLCPIHNETTPSFKITLTGEYAGRWKCFGCHESGDVIALRMTLNGETFPQAVEALARALGVQTASPPPKQQARRAPKPRVVRRTRWEITDWQTGAVVAIHERLDLSDGDKSYPWAQPDGTPNLGNRKTADLPLYRNSTLPLPPPGELVMVAEGEKAADSLVARGLFGVGTVTGAGNPPPNDAVLEDLRPYRVVLWPDNDLTGREHMSAIAEALVRLGMPCPPVVNWLGAPDKGDAADFPGDREVILALVEGAQPADTQPANAARPAHKQGRDDLQVLEAEFPPVRWAVPGILPEGFAVLAGPPKVGKSYLVLQLSGAVNAGGKVLGSDVEQGWVLYLALEDGWRRLQERMRKQLWKGTGHTTFHVDWPLFAEGGVEALNDTLHETDYRLCVIDTLARFLGGKLDWNDYAAMYPPLSQLRALAEETNTAIIGTTHHNKLRSGDNITDVLGSTAVTAAPDTILGLFRKEGGSVWTLKAESREAGVEAEIPVKRDYQRHIWQRAADEHGVIAGSVQAQIVDALAQLGGRGNLTEITAALGKELRDRGHLSTQLGLLVDKGAVIREEKQGREVPYRLPS